MMLRNSIHAAGRPLTRALLHPRWRHRPSVSRTYLQLYLLGKRLTERRELATLRSLIVPGMVIADIGANVGFYTLEMARCVGPTGRILAFEPDPFSFQLLKQRLSRAPAANVDAYQLALGHERARALLYCSAYNRADNRLSPSHAEPNVEACEAQIRTLDDVLGETGHVAIDALKIDVQGNEANVVRGARKTLDAGVRWMWIEFSPDHLRGSGQDPVGFLESLRAPGMEILQLTEDGSLQPLTDFREYTRKMGSHYGDIVLMSQSWRERLSKTQRSIREPQSSGSTAPAVGVGSSVADSANHQASPARHGRFASWLRGALAHPSSRGVDLDSAEATALHARLIREKPFLRRLYLRYYKDYESAVARAASGGVVVEVGAGGGFYHEVRPSVVSIDLRPGAEVDVVGSALALPLRDESASAVLLLNVLHHLPDPSLFFRECERVLRPGGRVCLIEPSAGPLSRRLIRPFHHEPWDEDGGWTLPPSGPLTGANMALPSIIFTRDRGRYRAEFPHLPIDRVRFHTIALYLLSGGVSMRSLVPGALFRPALAAERLLAPAGSLLASMMTVELVKR